MKPAYKPIFTKEEIKKSKKKENLNKVADAAKATAFAVGLIAVIGIAGSIERGIF